MSPNPPSPSKSRKENSKFYRDIPIKVNSQTDSRIVYALLDSGSDEGIIAKELYGDLTLTDKER